MLGFSPLPQPTFVDIQEFDEENQVSLLSEETWSQAAKHHKVLGGRRFTPLACIMTALGIF